MPFFFPRQEISTSLAQDRSDRFFAAIWLNLLESKSPALLGPQPLSVLGLLVSLRDQIEEGRLRPSTLSKQATATLLAIGRSHWLKRFADKQTMTTNALHCFVKQDTSENAGQCVRAITALIDSVRSLRISSHLAFILEPHEMAGSHIAPEIQDLIADLITLGHSESYLYTWGRNTFLTSSGLKPESLRDRIRRVAELGCVQRFSVAFQIAPSTWLLTPPNLKVGSWVAKSFSVVGGPQVPEGHTIASVSVIAADYKAAIEDALGEFQEIVSRTPHTSRRKRIRVTGDRFLVKFEDTGEEMVVNRDDVRPFEPPRMRYTASAAHIAKASPELARPIERTMYWLSNAAQSRGEAQFLSLWLALTSLFGDDAPAKIIPLLAKYRVLASIEAVAHWLLDYLKLVCQMRDPLWLRLRGIVSNSDSRKLLRGRAAAILQTLFSEGTLLAELREDDLMLDSRLGLLEELMNRVGRRRQVDRHEEELSVLLPAVSTTRNSIAHLASSSLPTMVLMNRSLYEDVALVADQVAAAGLGTPGSTLAAVHQQTRDDFEALALRTLADPHLSIHHVRQGRCSPN